MWSCIVHKCRLLSQHILVSAGQSMPGIMAPRVEGLISMMITGHYSFSISPSLAGGTWIQTSYSGNNSACSVECDGGSQQLSYQCRLASADLVEDLNATLCSNMSEPVLSQSCNAQPCFVDLVYRSECGESIRQVLYECLEVTHSQYVDDIYCASMPVSIASLL
jgi:hypothetical protein